MPLIVSRYLSLTRPLVYYHHRRHYYYYYASYAVLSRDRQDNINIITNTTSLTPTDNLSLLHSIITNTIIHQPTLPAYPPTYLTY